MNPNPYIGQTLRVIIDRPLGSRHPQYGYLYPINYGYLPGVTSGDGEDLDVYVLGMFRAANDLHRCMHRGHSPAGRF